MSVQTAPETERKSTPEVVDRLRAEQAKPSAIVVRDTGAISAMDTANLIERAGKQAKALAKIIEEQHLAVIMGRDKKTGKLRKHVVIEGWQTLGTFNHLTAITDSVSETMDRKGNYAVTAMVGLYRDTDGARVGGAEGYCSMSETKWNDRDDYAVRSMAQTRGASKAFRQKLAWVMVLAGYSATPAEEMHANAEEFDVPMAAEDKRRIDELFVKDGKAIYADDAQKKKVVDWMSERGFAGWADFKKRGGDLVTDFFTHLGIKTEFEADAAAVEAAPVAAPATEKVESLFETPDEPQPQPTTGTVIDEEAKEKLGQ